jgi:hypothetical protein
MNLSDKDGKELIMAEKREWNEEEADLAAKMAADELLDMMQDPVKAAVISELADLWRRHYIDCGHKRLGRVLMGVK